MPIVASNIYQNNFLLNSLLVFDSSSIIEILKSDPLLFRQLIDSGYILGFPTPTILEVGLNIERTHSHYKFAAGIYTMHDTGSKFDLFPVKGAKLLNPESNEWFFAKQNLIKSIQPNAVGQNTQKKQIDCIIYACCWNNGGVLVTENEADFEYINSISHPVYKKPLPIVNISKLKSLINGDNIFC